MAAFETERLEALRHEIQVFFGEEAYEACTTMEQCLAKLEEKDEEVCLCACLYIISIIYLCVCLPGVHISILSPL